MTIKSNAPAEEKIMASGESTGEGASMRKLWITTRLATSFPIPGGARDYLTWEVHLEDFVPTEATPDDCTAKIVELQGVADKHIVGEKDPTRDYYESKMAEFNAGKGV